MFVFGKSDISEIVLVGGHDEIFSLFSQDQKRVDKLSKRMNAIEEVKESVSLLSQLLEGYSKESCSPSNKELIKVSTPQRIQTSCRYMLNTCKLTGLSVCLLTGFVPAL